MKKITCLSFLIIFILSCQKNKQDLKLELLTNEIVCAENVKKNDFYEAFYKPNATYDSLSKNILHYKITNISDKKYFIMLNENELGTVERDLYREAIGKKSYDILNSIGFSLYKNDSILDGNSTKAEIFCGNDISYKLSKLESVLDNYKMKKTWKIVPIDNKEDFLQGYFIQPGETKYFTSIVNLPYRDNQKWLSNIEKKKPNLGSLSLQNDSIFTKRKISQDEKRNIKENGYILFDGKIYSNKVPVKLIKI